MRGLYGATSSVAGHSIACMAYDFQVVIDCAKPHTLADWWATTLD